MACEPKMAISLQACIAEYIAMALFVIFGCGSAMGIAGSGSAGGSGERGGEAGKSGETTSVIPGWVLMVALVFGLSITTLAYTIGHYSGGHINCAVTFGLVLVGECGVLQGLGNLAAQILGSITGAGILCAIYPAKNDMTNSLASNSVGPRFHWWNALIGEVVGTFLLMTVVLQTACSRKSQANRAQACLAIGLAVFVAHAVLIPIDGCSINPTRSFGPALVTLARLGKAPAAAEEELITTAAPTAEEGAAILAAAPASEDPVVPVFWRDMWIFWLGPLLGAALAAGVYRLMEPMLPADEKQEKRPASEDAPASAAAATGSSDSVEEEAPPTLLERLRRGQPQPAQKAARPGEANDLHAP